MAVAGPCKETFNKVFAIASRMFIKRNAIDNNLHKANVESRATKLSIRIYKTLLLFFCPVCAALLFVVEL